MATTVVSGEMGQLGSQANVLKCWHLITTPLAIFLLVSYRKWYQFGKTTLERLAEAEYGLFAQAGANLISRLIPINFKNSHIYTVTQKAQDQRASEPIVLVHGFGAGVAIWSRCIVDLSRNHTVHAIDILGFGRSSRPKFSCDAEEAEKELVDSIENWRSSMEIEKMHLVAHSFGAYLASQYALNYPHRVKHLILVDPWGFSETHPNSVDEIFKGGFRSSLISFALKFNPFSILRVAGSRGPGLIKRFRPDLMQRYPGNSEDDIYNYIYYCNSQSPTGEAAFKNMSHLLGWAKRPMVTRFRELHENVPVSFILGGKSWIDPEPVLRLHYARPNQFKINVIENAGHHVYADDTANFNEAVQSIVDNYLEQQTKF